MTSFIDRLTLEPTIQFLEIIPFITAMLLLIHFIYTGVILWSTATLIFIERKNTREKRICGSLVPARLFQLGFFGLFPLLTLALLYRIYFQGSAIRIDESFASIIPLVFFGYCALYLFHRSSSFFAGIIALLGLGTAYLALSSVLVLAVHPEKFQFFSEEIPGIFSIGVALFITTVALVSLSFSGIWFLAFKIPHEPKEFDSKTMASFGRAMTLLGILFLPVVLLLDLATLPRYALSPVVFILTGSTILLLFLLTLIVRLTGSSDYVKPQILLIGITVVYGLIVAKHGLLIHTSNLDRQALGSEQARMKWDEMTMAREVEKAKAMKADPAIGELVYTTRCTACHDWNKKVVGPAYREVIGKYLGKEADLIDFIRNPRKIDPTLTTMPRLGLAELEIKSVAFYLLDRFAKEKGATSR